MADEKKTGGTNGSGATRGSVKPVIFVSYSRLDEPEDGPEDEKWLTYVLSRLGQAVRNGIFDIWVDEDIPGGEKWKAAIAAKLDVCDVCILLVSSNSLASEYVIDVEVETIRKRQETADVPLFPIVIKPFATKAVPWLMEFNLRPPKGESLWEMDPKPRERAMMAIVNEIVDVVAGIADRKKMAATPPLRIRLGEIKAILGKISVASYIDLGAPAGGKAALESLEHALEKSLSQAAPSIAIDITRLPETPYERLVGRENELKRLDEAWTSPAINVFSLVAEGGAGKSALVNEWLARMQADNYRGADAVFGWSFYSQGSKERATAADAFLNWALEKLGITLETTSASAKAKAIAEALAKRRVLLLLDGVEPLQHGPGPQTGQLKDLDLRALLHRFAATPPGEPHGLIVLTSRLAVADLARWRDTAAPVLDVDQLSDAAGAALLRDNGVWGTDKELVAAARDFAGHPLALGLLASFLKETQFGDVRRRDRIRVFFADADNPRHDHARRVMESYEKEWLADQPALLAIMHIVGLFDRPATADCLRALRAKPAIAGLTDALVGLSDDDWNRGVTRLREARLLSPPEKGPINPEQAQSVPANAGIQPDRDRLGPRVRGGERSLSSPETLDAHPLVHEWFGERLRQTNETAWRAAHGRLYEHLRDTTKEGDRPTLDQLAPLYQAIAHGCRAGRHQEALDEIYKNRIYRQRPDGGLEGYAIHKLGAYGSTLAATRWFFEEPYKIPVTGLAESVGSWVSAESAFCLSAQGRFVEALSAYRAILRRDEELGRYLFAGITASNSSEVELVIGEVAAAIATAKRAVAHADRSGEPFQMITKRLRYCHALHAAGRREEARNLVIDAKRIQLAQGNGSLCYPLQGYECCELLLALDEREAARDLAAKAIETARNNNWLLHIALDNLVLGRVHLGFALAADQNSMPPADRQRDTCIGGAHLDEAVDGLQAAGPRAFIPLGLLARAAFRRGTGDWQGAARDLDEVEEIADIPPMPMKLHLCDMALERARLALAQIEAFAPLNGLLETDSPPKPVPPGADEGTRLRAEAAKQLQIAADYVSSCGYHRRDDELAELQAVLAGEKTFASLPLRA